MTFTHKFEIYETDSYNINITSMCNIVFSAGDDGEVV